VKNEAMTIRCPECGYENRDMYRFCGMCGATLRREATVQAPASQPQTATAEVSPRPAEAEPVSSTPRFITEEPGTSGNLEYLLEEEAPKSRGKFVITLVLLLLAAGLMVWHWQRDGYPWAARSSAPPSVQAPAQNAGPPVASNSQPAAPAADAPAPKAQNPPPQSEATSSDTPSQATEPKAEAAAKKTDPAAPKETAVPDGGATDQTSASDAAASGSSTGADASQPSPAEATAIPPAVSPKPQPESRVVVAPTPGLRADDKLAAEGEKYLYGNGVSQDCGLAQKNLRIAAGHLNARAMTLMGAMYATGHCVTRDLPTAYRWFAKALHQDPSNSRVQQDLEILWKQMTPGERQMATKSGG
jgi:hypothetical protein